MLLFGSSENAEFEKTSFLLGSPPADMLIHSSSRAIVFEKTSPPPFMPDPPCMRSTTLSWRMRRVATAALSVILSYLLVIFGRASPGDVLQLFPRSPFCLSPRRGINDIASTRRVPMYEPGRRHRQAYLPRSCAQRVKLLCDLPFDLCQPAVEHQQLHLHPST